MEEFRSVHRDTPAPLYEKKVKTLAKIVSSRYPCPICRFKIKVTKALVMPKDCEHAFCEECLKTYLDGHRHGGKPCPVCKQEITGYTRTGPPIKCEDQALRRVRTEISKKSKIVKQIEDRLARTVAEIQKLEALIPVEKATLHVEKAMLKSLTDTLASLEQASK
jgi:hypothetical protein